MVTPYFHGPPPDQNIASAEQSEFEPGVLAKDIVLWCSALRNYSSGCPFRTMRWRGSPRDNIGPSDQGLRLRLRSSQCGTRRNVTVQTFDGGSHGNHGFH